MDFFDFTWKNNNSGTDLNFNPTTSYLGNDGILTIHEPGGKIQIPDNNLPQFLEDYEKYIKHFAREDPRFISYNALIHYNVGSQVNTIDRVYGTVSQKTYYPKLKYLYKYGTQWPSKELTYLQKKN